MSEGIFEILLWVVYTSPLWLLLPVPLSNNRLTKLILVATAVTAALTLALRSWFLWDCGPGEMFGFSRSCGITPSGLVSTLETPVILGSFFVGFGLPYVLALALAVELIGRALARRKASPSPEDRKGLDRQ